MATWTASPSRPARYYLDTNGWGGLTPVLTLGRLSNQEVAACVNAAVMAGDARAAMLGDDLARMSVARRAMLAVKAEKAAAAMQEAQ